LGRAWAWRTLCSDRQLGAWQGDTQPCFKRRFGYETGFKAGFLSFDSTRVSSNNVDFPIDVALYKKGTFELIEQRYTQRDMADISAQWDEELKNALINVPGEWMDKAFKKLPK
jgi:predicted proteasome-type protease